MLFLTMKPQSKHTEDCLIFLRITVTARSCNGTLKFYLQSDNVRQELENAILAL